MVIDLRSFNERLPQKRQAQPRAVNGKASEPSICTAAWWALERFVEDHKAITK